MEEITAIDKIDFILNLLYERKSENIEAIYTLIRNANVGIADIEIHPILLKLKEEKQIYQPPNNRYEISFDGKLFKENGGYRAKVLKDANDALLTQLEINRRHTLDDHLKKSASRLNRLTLWLAIGTGALALIEIIKFVIGVLSPPTKT
jgi:hypothetical protein